MTQGMLADALGVEQRSVRQGGSPHAAAGASKDAWDVLDAALSAQRRGIAAALGKVDEVAQEYGSYPESVALPYWSGQDAYDGGHYVDDGWDWRMANATNRLLAYALHERGIRVEWSDGPTVPRMGWGDTMCASAPRSRGDDP
jgi:lysozyme family protein